MQETVTNGLRERKKTATRLAIERAAVEIASEQGYDAATVEAIAARADVSLRTFFNYFPSKDVAIVGRGLAKIAEDRVLQILAESGRDLIMGVASVAEACAAEADQKSEFMRRRRRLIRENPPLFHPHVTANVEFDHWLARVVADHLRRTPGARRLTGQVTVEEEAEVVVAIVTSAIHYHIRRAIEEESDEPLSGEEIQRTLDLMRQLQRNGL